MKERGVIDKIYHPYLMTTRKSCPDQELIRRLVNKPKPIGTNTTVSSYLIVFIGIICALIVLVFEIMYS